MIPPLPVPGRLRPVRDDDRDGLIALVGAAYDEHPGCVLDLDDLDRDLTHLATAIAAKRGRAWVVESPDGAIGACVGYAPTVHDGVTAVELKRLYVAGHLRRSGLGGHLVGVVEELAHLHGARAVELWSDSRFTDAHRLYERLGYRRSRTTRDLHDPSVTTEFHLVRPLPRAPIPGRTVTWSTPHGGTERCRLSPLPDGGWRLSGSTLEPRGAGRYQVDVDATWSTRQVHVSFEDHGGERELTLVADGSGRWWRDGEPAADLDGALDVDLELTPSTNTLPLRRLELRRGTAQEIVAAWVRLPDLDVISSRQVYERDADGSATYRSGSFESRLTLDQDALVVDHGDHWLRSQHDEA